MKMKEKEYLVDADGNEEFFETIEEAVSYAQKIANEEGYSVTVKKIHRYDIEEIVRLYRKYGDGPEEFAERVAEEFYETFDDDLTFDLDVPDPKTAEEDWNIMIAAWVRKHVKPQPENWWWEEVDNVSEED
jgi:hypothetical protein